MMHRLSSTARAVRHAHALLGIALFVSAPRLWSQGVPPPASVTVHPPATDPTAGRLTGTIVDSTARAPLVSAVVQLVSEADPTQAWVAHTDRSGAFAFPNTAPGRYLIGFVHPRLDALLLQAPTHALTLRGGDEYVELAIPSLASMARTACGAVPANSSTAAVFGRVRHDDGSPLRTPARVTVRWSEIVIDQRIRSRTPSLSTSTDSAGIYRFCTVPANTNVQLVASADSASSGQLMLSTPADGILFTPLSVGVAERVRTDDAAEASLLRGPGVLFGVIVTGEGVPVARSRVRLFETAALATTDEAGQFQLTGLPTGTHTLEAFAIGFSPLRYVVDVTHPDGSSFDTGPVQLTLERARPSLDTVRVLATADPADWRAAFSERRARGLGRFLDEAMIARRAAQRTSDLLRQVPGLTIRPGRFMAEEQVLMRDASGGDCLPDLFVDGMRLWLDGANVDSYVAAPDVVGVEVYRSWALRPLEFTTENRCGAIVLWTERRTGRKR